jgi:hypothetical protein
MGDGLQGRRRVTTRRGKRWLEDVREGEGMESNPRIEPSLIPEMIRLVYKIQSTSSR